MNISRTVKDTLRAVAKKVTGLARRRIQAWVAETYCSGSPRRTETIFGWNRAAVALGIAESQSSSRIRKADETRGRPLVEVTNAELAVHADQLLFKDSQVDPKFQTSTCYTRMTGESLRAALAESLGIAINRLPAPRSLRRLMNRRGFSLKKVRKTIPHKKIPETNAIFDNVKQAHQRAENDSTILRISVDCKARVRIGQFSRGGYTRYLNSLNASDHDMARTPTVTPCGILEVASGQLSIGMVVGTTTSDAIVDTLELWWQERLALYPHIRTLMIDLDNGPDVESRRTQFIKRITQFADKLGVRIELVYYPPYHSKYNAVERCWSSLERHWNGTQLTTFDSVVQWARTMTWKKIQPIVWQLDNAYKRGVKLTKKEWNAAKLRLERLTGLERWSVKIETLPTLAT